MPKRRAAVGPWQLRFSPKVLSDDLPTLGAAAFALAKSAILKKLAVSPDQYGAPLRRPLQGMRKLSVSHVRVVYQVFHDTREVRVYMIRARRDIWDHDQPEIMARAHRVIASIADARSRKR